MKIQTAKQLLKQNYIGVDINYVLSEVLNLSYSNLNKITEISDKDYKKCERVCKKNQSGVPLQKIFKRAHFYNRIFFVNNNVLTPRYETELLCEEVLKNLKGTEKVLDVCSGSGAIILTIKAEQPNCDCYGLDISTKALNVAKKNAKTLKLNVNFFKSDMFNRVRGKFDVIVSNPPYIESDVILTLNSEVKNFDPLISLDGGKDGLKFYRIIYNNAESFLNENGKIYMEIGYNQAESIINMFEKKYKFVKIIKDYNNLDRILVFERR